MPAKAQANGDWRHRNTNAQHLVGPSSKDFQTLRTTLATIIGRHFMRFLLYFLIPPFGIVMRRSKRFANRPDPTIDTYFSRRG